MPQIKSFGCSFIYGSDLKDAELVRLHTARAGGHHSTASQHTWPALLAQHLGCEYQCYARPGSGNLQILNSVLNQVNHAKDACFVIGWSWIDRFDYTDHNDDWNTLLPGQDSNNSQMYYRYLHSQYKDKLTTLTYILTAITVLKQMRIPFVMTYMDDLLLEKEWHSTDAMIQLQQQVLPYLTNFQGKTFLNWAHEHKFPVGDQSHPLEAAHQAAFEYLQTQQLFG
jgi:hypothetical protein